MFMLYIERMPEIGNTDTWPKVETEVQTYLVS